VACGLWFAGGCTGVKAIRIIANQVPVDSQNELSNYSSWCCQDCQGTRVVHEIEWVKKTILCQADNLFRFRNENAEPKSNLAFFYY
jgi:hypothetical protein